MSEPAAPGQSRIAAARDRLERTKRYVAVGAAAAFAVAIPLARASNPGVASRPATALQATSDDGSGLDGLDGSSGQISPSDGGSYSGPTAQTGVS